MQCGCSVLTSEDWAELLPAGDATLGGVLAQGHLQEEDGQASSEQEDGVRDEKRTCGGKGGDGMMGKLQVKQDIKPEHQWLN